MSRPKPVEAGVSWTDNMCASRSSDASSSNKNKSNKNNMNQKKTPDMLGAMRRRLVSNIVDESSPVALISSSRQAGAFSSEMEIGSRPDNAPNQESKFPFRFHRTENGLRAGRSMGFPESSHGSRLTATATGSHAQAALLNAAQLSDKVI